MAIQVRRGNYRNFDKGKMLPGEPVAVLADDPDTPSGKSFYVCYAAGDVKRLVSIEDLEAMVAEGGFQGPKGDKGDQGVGISDVEIIKDGQQAGHLIIHLTDGTEHDAGYIDDALAKIDEAKQSASDAADSASASALSEKSAAEHESNAQTWAKTAQSYATGEGGVREGEALDNAKEYARQAKLSADQASEAAGGDFVTHAEVGQSVAPLDESRKVPKENIPADVGKVQGVKGEAEEEFRDGEVTIKKSDIGLGKVEDKSPSEILGGMTSGNVTTALGFTPEHQFKAHQTTLLQTGWQNNDFPYTYTIEVEGLTANQLVIVDSGGGLDKAQMEGYVDAIIDKQSQEDGKVILQAVNKPQVDLPVVLLIGGEPA